jgi:hypothetical protein
MKVVCLTYLHFVPFLRVVVSVFRLFSVLFQKNGTSKEFRRIQTESFRIVRHRLFISESITYVRYDTHWNLIKK